MTKRRGTIVQGPWSESQVLSLSEVYKITQTYWSDIVVMRKSVLRARKLFTKTIWPDQCDDLIASLREMSLAIRAFYEFLDKSEPLPLLVCSRRYPVVKALHKVDALLSDLVLLIIIFRSNSWTLSKQAILQDQEIQQKLEKLLQSWKEMQRNAKIFFNQMQVSLGEEIVSDRPLASILEFKSKESVLTKSHHRSFDSTTAEVQHQNEEMPTDL
jgi:hypothetical protein